jgi:ABC-type phosphate transport system substrate-binding protein
MKIRSGIMAAFALSGLCLAACGSDSGGEASQEDSAAADTASQAMDAVEASGSSAVEAADEVIEEAGQAADEMMEDAEEAMSAGIWLVTLRALSKISEPGSSLNLFD